MTRKLKLVVVSVVRQWTAHALRIPQGAVKPAGSTATLRNATHSTAIAKVMESERKERESEGNWINASSALFPVSVHLPS